MRLIANFSERYKVFHYLNRQSKNRVLSGGSSSGRLDGLENLNFYLIKTMDDS